MKRSCSFSMLVLFLLAEILAAGCSPSATAVQPDSNTRDAALISETAVLPSAEDTFPEDSGWTSVLECKVTHHMFLAGFLNEDFGVTLGIQGEIHYTNDGGKTWPESENTSTDRYCLDIVDENLLWSGGNMGNVCMSSDAGKSWTLVTTILMNIGHSNIDFVDDTTGWVASPTQLAGTSDGGQTWVKIPLPEGADGVAAICLKTLENGYLLSRTGILYFTSDGGATWSSSDLGFKDYDITELQKSLPTLADLSFADEMNGTIVFTGKSSSGKGYHTWCLTTCDGGATWEPELLPETEFTPSSVFLSDDGQYLTLSDSSGNVVLFSKKA